MLITIVLLLVLILCTSLFTGLEIAFFSLDDFDMQRLTNSKEKKAKILLQLQEKRDQLILSLVVVSNLINISASAINANLAIQLANQFRWQKELTISLATVLLTLLIILLGEAIPKIIGIRANVILCWHFAPFLEWVRKITFPLVSVIMRLMRFLEKVNFSSNMNNTENFEAAYIGFTEKSTKEGLLRQEEGEAIQNVLDLKRKIGAIMRPRNQMFCLKAEDMVKDVLDKVMTRQFSRIPLYSGDLDNIRGVILLKDIFQRSLQAKGDTKLIKLAAPPIFVQEIWPIWNVLHILKKHKSHLAVVVDEFGGVSGIVTLEDIIEEVVGEIDDEKDDSQESLYKQIGENLWELPGLIEIRPLNRILHIDIEEDQDFETLQGYFMYHLKRIPKIGDKITHPPYLFEIKEMHKNEIKTVQVQKNTPKKS